MRHIVRLSLLTFALLFAVSCTKKAPSNTLQVAMRAELSSLDPQIAEGESAQEILSLIYEPLLDYSLKNGFYEIAPLLLSTLPQASADGMTLSMELKAGQKFPKSALLASARDIESDDVLFTILRLADPHLNSPNYWLIERQILGLDEWREKQKAQGKTNYSDLPSGLRRIDKLKFQVKLSVQNPQILHAFATVALGLVPREVGAKESWNWAENAIGSGPYKILNVAAKDSIEVARNTEHANTAFKGAERILAKYFKSEAVKVSAIEQGEMDIAPLSKSSLKQFVNIEKRQLLDSVKNLELHEKALLDVIYVGFNMEDPVIQKAGTDFRKALSLAINREEYNRLFNEGSAHLAQGPLPSGVAGYDKGFVNRYAQFDVAKAKEFLARSPAGKAPPTLVFESLDSPEALKFAENMKESLSQIGVGLEISKNSSLGALVEKIRKKQAQVWLLSWQADYPDAENFLQLLYGPNKTPSPNFSNFDDKQYNRVFTRMRSLNDSPQRRKDIEELLNLFVRHTPWVPLVHRVEFYVASKRVGHFQPKQFGSSAFKEVSLTETK
jgi:oligopeptide transport system substrate-binding protein